ncbi:hypothetical protein [Methylobacterium radiotolerans]|jgi:hypothetical protein
MMHRLVVPALLFSAVSSHALAWDASKSARYPSVDLYRPEADSITLHGSTALQTKGGIVCLPGGACPLSGLSLAPTASGFAARPLAQSVFPPNAGRAATYSVTGDGVTDDAAALRAANAAVKTPGQDGGSLTLDSHPGYLIGSGVTLGNGQQWSGAGATLGLKCKVSAGACATLIGNYSGLYNLPLTFVGINGLGSVGVQMGAGEQGSSPVLRDSRIIGFDTGIDIQSNVTGKLDNVSVDGSKNIGIRTRNIANSDAGDWTWLGVKVDNFTKTGDLVSYESGGGLKVLGFKGLGGDIGWHMKLPDGTATQDFQFSGNSIENSGTACMKFERVAGGTTGVFGNISIVGNEFAGCPTGLWFAGPGASGAVITGNNFSSISGFPIKLDPGANNIVVGQNTVTGAVSLQDNRTAFADEYGFLNRADTVAIDTSSSTNYAYAYHVTVPPFRSASIHLVLEGVIQGVGGFVRDEEFLLTNTGAGPLVVTQKSSTQGGSATIDFAVGTNTPGVADLGYRLNQGGRIQGTATIVPLGKMVSVSR